MLLTFQHRADVSPYTSPCGFAETCVFDKQSLEPIHCGFSEEKHPFSLSYGFILPSSLTRGVPLTFKCSSCLAGSSYGSGTGDLARGLSCPCEIRSVGTKFPSPSQLEIVERICLFNSLAAWTHTTSGALFLSSCVSPSFK